MDADPMDLSAFQPGATSIEKQYQSKGVDYVNKYNVYRPMSKGVHRTVCQPKRLGVRYQGKKRI